jgi:hypothetical protein
MMQDPGITKKKSLTYPTVRSGCWILIRGSIIGYSNLSGSNSLTNRVLNKNIKIIFLYMKNNKKSKSK